MFGVTCVPKYTECDEDVEIKVKHSMMEVNYQFLAVLRVHSQRDVKAYFSFDATPYLQSTKRR